MKKYIATAGLILCYCTAIINGIICRQSYTDLQKQEDYLTQLQVAEFPSKMTDVVFDGLEDELLTCPCIMKVEPLEDIEYLFGAGRQLVKVIKNYTEEGAEEGQEIYITSSKWLLSLVNEPKSVEMGFVNVMKQGHEYIVFSDGEISGTGEKIPVYCLYEDTYISTVFGTDPYENKSVSVEDHSTYVPYELVDDNEFFSDDEAGVESWNQLKTEIAKRLE